jgi:hypothetical protein
MKHTDIKEGETYHFVATTDPSRRHLEGTPFTVAKLSAVHRRAGKAGRKRYRAYDAGGGWAEPDELEPLPEWPCPACKVGEMQQDGGTTPSGTTYYKCAICGKREGFP